MTLWRALALASWAATPVLAQPLDDATCGVIAEYAMDLAADAGSPVTLAPTGVMGADDQGCFATELMVLPNSSSGLRIGYLRWSGQGLQDWVAGHGLPLALNLEISDAHIHVSIPDMPAYAWSSNIAHRRAAVTGVLNARWSPQAGRVDIDRLELGNAANAITLSATITGIKPEPSQIAFRDLSLKALNVTADMAGMFETLVLTPFVAALMGDAADPAETFEGYIAQARAGLDLMPEPQVDQGTKLALNRFLSHLPSPTGRLTLKMDAPDGFGADTVMWPMLLGANAAPDHLRRIIASALGGTTFRVNWQPQSAR